MTVSACEDRFTVLLFIAFQSAHDDIKNSKSHSLSRNDDKRTNQEEGSRSGNAKSHGRISLRIRDDRLPSVSLEVFG